MSKKKNTTLPPIVITLTLPSEGGIQRTGTLLIQRGDLAHIGQFNYCNLADIMTAIQEATRSLTNVELNPPVIKTDVSETTVKTTPKVAAPATEEPTIDIQTKTKGMVAVKLSYIKIVKGETDAAAYRFATLIAARLIDAGLWDGGHPIRISNAFDLHKQLKALSDDELKGMPLTQFVEVSEEAAIDADDEKDNDDGGEADDLEEETGEEVEEDAAAGQGDFFTIPESTATFSNTRLVADMTPKNGSPSQMSMF